MQSASLTPQLSETNRICQWTLPSSMVFAYETMHFHYNYQLWPSVYIHRLVAGCLAIWDYTQYEWVLK